jgi:simple sugar transport system permease protein
MIGMEMTIISIVVLGGVNINGGKGSIFGVILGLIFVTIINNSLILVGLSSYWHTLILGLAMYINAAITAYKIKLASKQVKEVELNLK